MYKMASLESGRRLAWNHAIIYQSLDFLKSNWHILFSFVALYLKFDITDPYVMLCQNDTEYLSRQPG